MKKIKNISRANSKIIDSIESLSFSISTLMAVGMISYGMFDYGIDSTLDSIYTHPKAYIISFAAPIIAGYLITKLDPNSPTAYDINELTKTFKPKTRTRKK